MPDGKVSKTKDYSFSRYAKLSEKLTFFNPWYAQGVRGVRNVSFSENFAYVLNEWSLSSVTLLIDPWWL